MLYKYFYVAKYVGLGKILQYKKQFSIQIFPPFF